MSSHRRSAPLVAVVGVLAGLAAAEPAHAQMVQFGYSSFPAILPRSMFSPFVPNVPGRFIYQGVTVTGVGPYGEVFTKTLGGFNTTASVGPVYGGLHLPTVAPTSAGSAKVASVQRSAIDKAQRGARGAGGVATNPDFDRWLKDAANRRDTPPAVEPAAKQVIDPALIVPDEPALLSGEVLNHLVTRIRELEKEGRRAKSGLLAPELTTRIVFAGGSAADAANLFREPTLKFPTALEGAWAATMRGELEKAFEAVAKEAHAGKKANAADLDRLIKAVAKGLVTSRILVDVGVLYECCYVCFFLWWLY
ncbi:MAG: hypothetical protein MUF18_19980, partial [Fimbriiglobus sp.]|nr:hypothetical protein [Fimbriiglobus sp.]